MRILVTGGAGYIGSHTVLRLIAEGYEPVIADNFSNSSPSVLPRLEALSGTKIPCVRAELTDREEVRSLFDAYAFDAVVHFAGLKAVGESVSMPVRYYSNNLISTLYLLEEMASHGVHSFVFSSSATVYGVPEKVPIPETAPAGGTTNPYATTKYMIEEILRDAAKADPSLGVCALRYFNPVGAHPSGMIGENPRGIPNNLMPFITQVAIGRREYLSVFGDDYDTPDGTGVRDYIHVCDLADGHVAALKKLFEGPGVYTYNLGSGRGYSVLELVHAFEKACGREIPYRITGRRPGDIAVSCADPSLARKELGWTAKLSLDRMCEDSWRWQRNNPDGYGDEAER